MTINPLATKVLNRYPRPNALWHRAALIKQADYGARGGLQPAAVVAFECGRAERTRFYILGADFSAC